MAKWESCSSDYLASEFYDSLTRSGRHVGSGMKWRATQYGDRVDFWFAKKRYDILFENNGEGVQATLEVIIEGTFEPLKVIKLKPTINKSGKIPRTYFPKAILIELTNSK